ncbi:MAG TPA: phosphonate metabolism protein PhnM [Bradyrhizobium sp.]
MQTFLVILGIWLLINVLFVVIMIPPRKPDHVSSSIGLAPARIEPNAYAFDDDEKVSMRHMIIAIALGTLFSLTPPLLEAVDDIKRLIGKYRKPRQHAEAASDERSLETVLGQLRAREKQASTDGSSSDGQDASKR